MSDPLTGLSLVNKLGEAVPTSALYGKRVALYFSAYWCMPSVKFTSQLKKFYESLKTRGENFEIIFVSNDMDQADFEKYYSGVHGDWLAVRFDSPARDGLAERFQVRALPTLLMLNGRGESVVANARGAVHQCATEAKTLETFAAWKEATDIWCETAGKTLGGECQVPDATAMRAARLARLGGCASPVPKACGPVTAKGVETYSFDAQGLETCLSKRAANATDIPAKVAAEKNISEDCVIIEESQELTALAECTAVRAELRRFASADFTYNGLRRYITEDQGHEPDEEEVNILWASLPPSAAAPSMGKVATRLRGEVAAQRAAALAELPEAEKLQELFKILSGAADPQDTSIHAQCNLGPDVAQNESGADLDVCIEIGPDGGHLISSDERAILYVPENAVSKTTLFSIRRVLEPGRWSTSFLDCDICSPVYDFQPEDVTFDGGVLVCIAVNGPCASETLDLHDGGVYMCRTPGVTGPLELVGSHLQGGYMCAVVRTFCYFFNIGSFPSIKVAASAIYDASCGAGKIGVYVHLSNREPDLSEGWVGPTIRLVGGRSYSVRVRDQYSGNEETCAFVWSNIRKCAQISFSLKNVAMPAYINPCIDIHLAETSSADDASTKITVCPTVMRSMPNPAEHRSFLTKALTLGNMQKKESCPIRTSSQRSSHSLLSYADRLKPEVLVRQFCKRQEQFKSSAIRALASRPVAHSMVPTLPGLPRSLPSFPAGPPPLPPPVQSSPANIGQYRDFDKDGYHMFFFMRKCDFLKLPDHEPYPRFDVAWGRGLLFSHIMHLSCILNGVYKEHGFCCISHKWKDMAHPDPDREQLHELKVFLQDNSSTDITWIWIDYCCLPQDIRSSSGEMVQKRTPEEARYFRSTLSLTNLLYVGLWVYILYDSDYNRRFWCRLESYLATHTFGKDGLISSLADPHHIIICMGSTCQTREASIQYLQDGLNISLNDMIKHLRGNDIHVTNEQDREEMLHRIENMTDCFNTMVDEPLKPLN